MAIDDGSSSVIASTVVMVAIIASIAFVFLILVFVMIKVRRVALNKAIRALLDDTKNDRLRVDAHDLGRIYETAKETWNRRADLIPVPELRRLPDGWMHNDQDDTPFDIRLEVAKSAARVCAAALRIDERFRRRRPQTVRQLLMLLLERGDAAVERDTIDAYLRSYEKARFASAIDERWTPDQFREFRTVFQQLMNQISRR
jgi:hypothetical protein